MENFTNWWQHTPKNQKNLWMTLCYLLIALASFDIGRTLYQAFHSAS